jgi:murein DD-endopeptidase MepM/ murein hydrolase activator NlpD
VLQQRLCSPDKVRVGDVLIQKGLISSEELAQALLEQRNTQALLTHHQLRAALNEQQWRNWTAALLFVLGSLTAGSPKLVTAAPIRVEKPPAASGQNFSSKFYARNFAPGAQSDGSLAANPHPTISSPLQGFCHPLNGLGYLSQGINGTTHRGRMAYAYDLASSIGTPVYAMRAGQVIGVQDRYPDTGGGPDKISKFNYVMVEHDGGYRSAYVHLQQGFRSTVQIKAGDRVEKGQLIGYSGNSGWSTGPHLHVEIQRPGSAFTFTQTVPFAIAGLCEPGTVAMARQ